MSARLFQADFGVDAVDWLKRIDDGSVALGVTDYAYESLEKHRAKGTTTRLSHSDASSNDWFQIFRDERVPELLGEFYRVLAADSHLYMLCDDDTSDVIKPAALAAGFTWWGRLVWAKGSGPEALRLGMGYHYRRTREFVVFLEKGKRKLADLSVPDVLYHPPIRGGYPTEKPVSLLRVLITQSTSPGELVIDPFMGSGSTGEAALIEGRVFAGCDLRETTPALARLRDFGEPAALLRARSQGRLFG